jgi:hypothetical protein
VGLAPQKEGAITVPVWIEIAREFGIRSGQNEGLMILNVYSICSCRPNAVWEATVEGGTPGETYSECANDLKCASRRSEDPTFGPAAGSRTAAISRVVDAILLCRCRSGACAR